MFGRAFRSLGWLSLTISLLAKISLGAQPAGPGGGFPAVETALRRHETARLRLERFDRVDFPRRVSRLEDMIELAKARRTLHEREVAEYGRFDGWRYSQPMFFSLERAKIDLLAARLEVERLVKEKCRLVRFRVDERRLLELEVESAAAEIERLLGGARLEQPARAAGDRVVNPSDGNHPAPRGTEPKKPRQRPFVFARLR